MTYFTQEFLDFFQELAHNNHRDWFHSHKSRYERHVKKPFHTFVADLIDRIHEDDPRITLEPKHAIFRINRDIRFSKDKTPYKTNVSAVISPQGRKDFTYPGFYIDFSHQKLYIGGGAYSVQKDQLERIRFAIATQSEAFQALLDQVEFKEKYGELKGEKNKRLPKELKEVAEKQPLIFNKQFYYMAELDSHHVLDHNLMDLVMEYYYAAKPMKDFLIGPMQKVEEG